MQQTIGANPTNQVQQAGFTLVEVLVAAALIAVISTLSFMAISSAARTQQILSENMEREADLQLTVARLRQDLFSLSPRAIRDDRGDFVGAFAFGRGRSDYELEFTRNSRAPLLVADTGLERVAYDIEADNLYRYSWEVLDRPSGTDPRRSLVLSQVSGIDLRALDTEGEWRDNWPFGIGEGVNYQLLPELIELEIKLDGGASIRLVIPGVRAPLLEE